MMAKTLVFSLFILILLGIDWYAFQGVKFVMRNTSVLTQTIIKVFYWLVPVLLIITIVFIALGIKPNNTNNTGRWIFGLMFALNYFPKLFFIFFVFTDDISRTIQYFWSKINHLFGTSSNNQAQEVVQTGVSRSEFLLRTGIILATLPLAAAAHGVVSGAHSYRIRKETLYFPDLPQSFDGFKILQLSDIHCGSFINREAVLNGVRMAQNLNPDVIFFTGDLVNDKADEAEAYVDVFGSLHAPHGVYSILGNHDYGDYVQWESEGAKQANFDQLCDIHRRLGWKLLRNEHSILTKDGEQLAVIGVENWGDGFIKKGDLKKAYQGVGNIPVKILLSHDPTHWDAQVRKMYPDIDLTLAGHTHGMQFGVEIGGFQWSPASWRYKQWGGLYKKDNQYIYVNRGFGYIGFPGRIGMYPEITLIELKKGSALSIA